MTWTVLKPWLVMALIFVAGMVAGAALLSVFRPELPHGPPGMQQLRNHWLMHLTHELNLTPDQQAKVEPILNDAGTRIQALHRDEVENISKIMDDANEKIAPLLTTTQQEELKKLRQDRERAFSGHLRPWEEPHGPEGPEGSPGPPQEH